jgi:hypothetical protein
MEARILIGCALNANAKYYLQKYIVRVGTLHGFYWQQYRLDYLFEA